MPKIPHNNLYGAATCYHCGKTVGKGQGSFDLGILIHKTCRSKVKASLDFNKLFKAAARENGIRL